MIAQAVPPLEYLGFNCSHSGYEWRRLSEKLHQREHEEAVEKMQWLLLQSDND